jgi:hypothetical protein
MRRLIFAAAIAAVAGLCVPAHGQTVTRTVYNPSQCPNGQCTAPQFRSVGTVQIPTPARAFPERWASVAPSDQIPATSLPTVVSESPVVGTPVVRTVSYNAPVMYATPAPAPVIVSQPVYTASYTDREVSRQVSTGVMSHFESPPAGTFAGVGFSTRSADDAVNHCCYASRPRLTQSVRYGYNSRLRMWGWFAAILAR